MRVAFTLHTEMIEGAGAPTAVTSLAAALRGRGHRTSLLTLSDSPDALPHRLKMLAFPVITYRAIRRELADIDVVDASTGDAWLFGMLRRRSGPLLVTHSHGLEQVVHDALMADVARGRQAVSWKYPIYNGGIRLWEVRQSLAKADACVFLNRYDKNYAVDRLGLDASRCCVMPNGCDDDLLDTVPTLIAPVDTFGIAFIGSYIARKGTAYAAEAINRFLRDHPKATVGFYGVGCAEETVLRDFDPALHGRITVVPRFDRKALPALMADRQVLLFPSLAEGFPLALLEAMACGLAPIVTDIPGPTEIIIDRHNGLVVPAADGEALYKALEQLHRSINDLQRLRSAARRTAEGFRWSRIAEQREELYNEFRARRR